MNHHFLMLTLILLAYTSWAAVPLPSEQCWGDWYTCMSRSAQGTGTNWQACARRCQCQGWTSGECRPVRECTPAKPWGCHCHGPLDKLHFFQHIGLCSQRN